MGYKNPVWHNGMAPSINDDRLNDLCYTVERLDFADGRVVVGQKEGETLGTNATSEGTNTIASGASSHAEGSQTTASGTASHAEGKCAQEESLATVSGPISAGATTYTVGSAIGEFRVGAAILAQNNGANLTGGAIITAKTETTITVSKSLNPTTAIASSDSIDLFATGMAAGEASHSEGQNTTANGDNSHSEGLETVASGEDSHSEGYRTLASGEDSHSEGWQTTSGGTAAHSEGNYTVANGIYSHSEGDQTTANGKGAHGEGFRTTASGNGSHSEGNQTISVGNSSHAEGAGRLVSVATINGPINANETTYQVGTSAASGFRIGYAVKGTVGSNSYFASVVSKASGSITLSASLNPDAALTSDDTLTIYKIEGVALTDGSHAEGLRTIASGLSSHSEGTNTVSSGSASHSEGAFTNSIGDYSHSEGNNTTASGNSSHSEGANTTASGNRSHAEGQNTTAAGDCQHVFGMYNASNTTDVEIVGWGTASEPKNIRTLDNSGNMTIAGTLTQSSDAQLKTVEGEIPDVSEIHAVRFRWNDANGQHDDIDHVGYIAQDVEKVAPFMVKNDSNGYKALDYIAFLCAKMELLERRVKELEEKKG